MRIHIIAATIFTLSYGFLCNGMDREHRPTTKTYIITTKSLIEFIHKDLGVNLAKVFTVAETNNLKHIKNFISNEFERMQAENAQEQQTSGLLQILLSLGIPVERDHKKELKYAKLLAKAQKTTDSDDDLEKGEQTNGTSLVFNMKEKSDKKKLYKKIWNGINTIIRESLTPPAETSASESSVRVGDEDTAPTGSIFVPSCDILIIHDSSSGNVLITRSPYQDNKFDIGLTAMALAATSLAATANGINAGTALGLFGESEKNKQCMTITALSLFVIVFALNIANLGVQIANIALTPGSGGNGTNS